MANRRRDQDRGRTEPAARAQFGAIACYRAVAASPPPVANGDCQDQLPQVSGTGDHGMLRLVGGGAVQDAGADVAAGLVEGHHDGTVAQVTDIRA
ncbi:MAG: hypothetical protein ACRDND_00115 [Streptosporangiaceae bacterium]